MIMQDAEDEGDEGGTRLLQHLYTRLQEELEKKTKPALALLHKLTRMDNPGVRAWVGANLLTHLVISCRCVQPSLSRSVLLHYPRETWKEESAS